MPGASTERHDACRRVGCAVKTVHVAGATGSFDVVAGTRRSQAATMVLAPGQTTGGDDNVHDGADQWLYVVAGSGEATVSGRAAGIAQGDLLLIEAGERHEIRNTGSAPLVTVNVYAPPEY
jgi:mannose-6-phosphate isomerase-like protein (cupin superfamily)